MSYRKGAEFEREVQDLLEAKGSVVGRCAGSKGISGADLFELRPAGKCPRLVQCKKTLTPWSGFGPADRKKLLTAATLVGAEAVLCWRKVGTSRVAWIGPDGWP